MRRAFLICALLTACDQDPGGERADIDRLETRVDQLERRISELWPKVIKLEGRSSVMLTPDEKSFLTAESDIGSLTFRLIDVKQYANGSRVKIEIGNPHAATIVELHAKLSWGPMNADGAPDFGNNRIKDYKFPLPIPGGNWRIETIDLADIPPEKLGYVWVESVSAQRISMNVTPGS